MEAASQLCHSRTSGVKSPPPRDKGGDDILLDAFFDHSQPLDNSALDALLDTTFDSPDDASTATSSKTALWRPAYPEAASRSQQPSPIKMETRNDSSNAMSDAPSHSDLYSLPATTATEYFDSATSVYPPLPPFDHYSGAHGPLPMRLGGPPTLFNQAHYYAVPNPIPNASDFDQSMPPPQHHVSYHKLLRVDSREGTADLLEYDEAFPEEEEEGIESPSAEVTDPCYAQLLYRCLLEAPEHTMTLKDVYAWVSQNSQKAKEASTTGWQNSVRHNLSMNAAFERVTSSRGPKKCSLWRLTQEALQKGVISTTRYRKDPKRKSERRAQPAVKRQISGAKGGKATRDASAQRRAMQARASGIQHIGGIERHRRTLRRQEPPFFSTSNSMPPPPNRVTSSPQPNWMPSGLPDPTSSYFQHPASPYFLPSTEDQFTIMGHHSMSNPHTPNEVQLGYGAQAKPMTTPSDAFSSPPRSFLTEFELQHIPHEDRILFGNHDDFAPDTPSLATEGSFVTDEMTPATMDRLSVEPMRS